MRREERMKALICGREGRGALAEGKDVRASMNSFRAVIAGSEREEPSLAKSLSNGGTLP